MTTFSRDQFKATSTKTLKKIKEEEDKLLEARKPKTDEIEIEEGLNKIRIAPKFPDEKGFFLLEKRTWLPFEKDDGEIVRIPVMDSKIHGGTSLDIIEEYLKFIKSKLDPSNSGDASKLSLITDWKKGIVPQHSWKAYAWKIKKDQNPLFGVFSFKVTVKNELISLSMIEDEGEIEVDPFTDPDDGIPILLTYNPKAKKADQYYNVKMSKNSYALTDEMIEELSSKKPLSEVFRNVYKIEDFEKALDGLRIYDVENEIDLIEEEEFEEIIAKVRSQYVSPEKTKSKNKSKSKDEDEEEEEKPKKSSTKSLTKTKVEDGEDEDDEEEEKPKKSLTKTKVKVEEDDEDEDEDEEEEKPKKVISKKKNDEEEEEEKPKKAKMSIEDLRARLANKQGK